MTASGPGGSAARTTATAGLSAAHDDQTELPDGVNEEEARQARMLEAAMFGTAYQGHIPDFSNMPAPENLDPDLALQRMLRKEQDAAFQESLMVRAGGNWKRGSAR